MTSFNSAIYQGQVVHTRYQVADHQFHYPLYMFGLDLDEIDTLQRQFRIFSLNRFNLFSFRRSDYLGDPATPLKQSVLDKVKELGGSVSKLNRVLFLGQIRCFGFYFSPVNFYFCFDAESPAYLLAEVHNTPWNESHCYLVDLNNPQLTRKAFHVSPFMGMDMSYQWTIRFSPQQVYIHIENWNEKKLFEATLALKHHSLNRASLLSTLKQWPLMSLSILRGIYWQAIRLVSKRVPYHSHP